MRVKEIMTTEVITIKKENTVEDVVKLLLQHNISGMPVVDDENYVIGIITEGDLIYRSKKLQIPSYFTILDSYIFLEPNTVKEQIQKMVGNKVEDVMTEAVIVVKEDDTVEEVATIITNKKVNRLPVVKDGKLVGIVSRRDIIKAFSK